MSSCGESDFEKIEMSTLYDLNAGKIFIADIISIDPVNNCASISINESCPSLSGKDLSAVEFFYHCENSTGTVEDLKNGYRAFSPDDSVYAILLPENGGVDERFYIIGHVGIRDTRKCYEPEFLILNAVSKSLDEETHASYVVSSIFDVSSGTPLILSEFRPYDDESPAAPSLPSFLDTDFNEWFLYNFKKVSLIRDPDFEASSFSETIFIAQEITHTPGSGYCLREESLSGTNDTTYLYEETLELNCSDYDSSINSYLDYTIDSTISKTGGSESSGWKIVDSVDGYHESIQTYFEEYDISSTRDNDGSRSTSCPGIDAGWIATYSYSYDERLKAKKFDGTTIDLCEFGYEWFLSSQYTVCSFSSVTYSNSGEYITEEQHNGSVLDMCVAVGRNGMYSLCGLLNVHREYTVDADGASIVFTGDTCVDPGDECNKLDVDDTPDSLMGGWVATDGSVETFVPYLLSTATEFTNDDPAEFSVANYMSRDNSVISDAIVECAKAAVDMITSQWETDGTSSYYKLSRVGIGVYRRRRRYEEMDELITS